MPVNIVTLNSVQAANVSTINLPYIPDSDQLDILYQLGTSIRTVPFVNPIGSNVLLSHTGVISSGIINNIIGRNTNGVQFNPSGLPYHIKIEFLNNYEVDLSTITFEVDNLSGVPYSFRLEGSNDNTNWVLLERFSSGSSPLNVPFSFPVENRQGFFRYIRVRFTDHSGSLSLVEIKLYGKLRNLVTGVAGQRGIIGTFDNYPDIDANRFVVWPDNVLLYDGTTWEARPTFPWEVRKEVLTGDLTLTTAHQPIFYVISPNGANREIILPDPPTVDDTVRIKNLDGAFDLTVKQNPTDLTPVVLNNAGKLQYEFVYDGVAWLVTG